MSVFAALVVFLLCFFTFFDVRFVIKFLSEYRGISVRFLFTLVAIMSVMSVHAEVLDIDIALNNTRAACSGISEKLSPLKTMAGINTGITGVGTAVNTGATVVGIVKASKDKQAEELEIKLEKLREIEEKNPQPDPTDEELSKFGDDFAKYRDTAIKELEEYQAELDKLNQQSKSLGNWRTGLMAGGTVTNVAGAVVAGNNRTDETLKSMIDRCNKSVKDLRDSMMQARMENRNIGNAEKIVSECGAYETVDLAKIDDRATGAMISSIVGATTGAAGTVTSVMANTDKTRDDNSDAGKQKEKNLNTASNVLAGASTAASATATVFNATQISAIKKVSNVADNCEKELAK